MTKTKTAEKDNDKVKHIKRTPLTRNFRELLPLRHLIRVMRTHDLAKKNKQKTMTKTKTNTKTTTKTWHGLWACEIVDISDSWGPEFMTIIVTWQLKGTLDSIRNSCDVSTTKTQKHKLGAKSTDAVLLAVLFCWLYTHKLAKKELCALC